MRLYVHSIWGLTMEQKELEIYQDMVKQKYKHFNLWRILAITFMILTVVFAILYFASGSIVTTEENITNNNDVEIYNEAYSYGTNNVTVNN